MGLKTLSVVDEVPRATRRMLEPPTDPVPLISMGPSPLQQINFARAWLRYG